MKTMLLSLAAAVIAHGAAAGAPSFDCAKASSKTEKLICRDKGLMQEDAEIASLYRQSQAALAPAAAALLQKDQKEFLKARDLIFVYRENAPAEQLRLFLQGRIEFLRAVRVPPGEGLEGDWSNVTGSVTLSKNPDGSFHFGLDTNEPVAGRWVCSMADDGPLTGGELVLKDESDGSAIKVSREGQALKVETIKPPNSTSWASDHCGRGGWVDGIYFSTAPTKK